MKRWAISPVLLAGAATAYSQLTWAQSVEAAPTDDASSSGLAEVVVTAQFRSQSLQNTPLAISAVNAATMEAKHQVSIADVAATSPSVSITANANGGGPAVPVVTIRGIGQTDAIGGVEPGVGVYVDDVYYGILNGAVFELMDLDRVEVLRGPQGTLSGKNSEGGSIKLYSKAPDNTLGGSAELTYGSYDRTQGRASVNIPIVDEKVMLRVSGVYRHEDGYIKRLDYRCVNPGATAIPLVDPNSTVRGCELGTAGGQDLAALRSSLRLVFTDNIADTLIADRITDHHGPDPAQLIFATGWSGAQNYITAPRSYTNFAAYVGYLGTTGQYQEFIGNDADQYGFSNKFEAGLGSALTLSSITAYRHTDAHGGEEGGLAPYTPFQQDTLYRHRQTTQELRLSGQVGHLADFTVGGFYYKGDALMPSHIDIQGGVQPNGGFVAPGVYLADFTTNDPIKTKSTSGFAHGVLHLTDALNLTAGLRYTSESKDYVFHRYPVDNGNIYALNALIGALDGTPSRYAGSRWDWRAAIDYRFNPELLVYTQVATGFKGGGVNPRPYFPSQAAPYNPETVTTYESGFKSDLFHRLLRLNVAAFYSNFNNMQLIVAQCDSISPFPGAPCQQTTNAGNSRIWGLEGELTAQPVDGLTVDASTSYVRFKYRSVNPATGIPLGNTLPFLIKSKVSVGVQYDFPILAGKLTPRFDVAYQSDFETDPVDQGSVLAAEGAPNASLTARVPGYTLANARLTYTPDKGKWELAASVQNLFDRFYYTNKFDGVPTGITPGNPATSSIYNLAQGYVGKPRIVDVSVKYAF